MLRRFALLAGLALLGACSGTTSATTGTHHASGSSGSSGSLGGHLAGGATSGTTTTTASSTTGTSSSTTGSGTSTSSTSGFTTASSTSSTSSTSGTSTSSTSTSSTSTSTSTTTSGTTTGGTTTSGTTTGTSTTTTGSSTTGGTLPPGSSCTTYADCAGGGCIPDALPDGGPTGWTGGYCAPDCTSNRGVCGSGACVDFDTYSTCEGRCSAPGTGQSSCRSGYSCFFYNYDDGGLSTSTDGVCGPACQAAGAACDFGSSCDAQGYCDSWNLDAGVAGSSCTSDANCGPSTAGFCIASTLSDGGASDWPGGYCSAICTGEPDSFCGDGHCNYYLASGFAICEGRCTNPYTTGSRGGCRTPGYTCYGTLQADGGEDTSRGVCEQDCTINGCDSNFPYCHTDDGYCWNAP